LGAVIEGEYTVTPGSTVTILAGGRGVSGDFEAGGGGSTAVYIGVTLYIVAGGGGGEDNTGNGGPGVVANNGTDGIPVHAVTNCPTDHVTSARGGTAGAGGQAGEFCVANIEGGGGGGGLNSAGTGKIGAGGLSTGGGQGIITGAAGGVAGVSTLGAGDLIGSAGGWGWSGGGGGDHRESGGGAGYSGGGGAGEGGSPGGGGSFLIPGFTSSFTADGTAATVDEDGIVTICYNNILPLTLLSFFGTANDNYNIIKWSTAEEYNLDRFRIERSADGRNFIPIGDVTPVNNGRGSTYEFRDFSTSGSSKFYYRLQVLENSGTEKFSSIIILRTKNQPEKFAIYPNPVSDNLLINSSSAILKIEIISATGGVLYSGNTVNLTVPISVKHFPPGTYIIKAYTGTETLFKKFIKQ
jgi:hypothetical protein